LAYKIQTLGNYPAENIQHTERGKNLKSRNTNPICKKTQKINDPNYTAAEV
jgi:hypothetical protein